MKTIIRIFLRFSKPSTAIRSVEEKVMATENTPRPDSEKPPVELVNTKISPAEYLRITALTICIVLSLGLFCLSILMSRSDSWEEVATLRTLNFAVIGPAWAITAILYFRGKKRIVIAALMLIIPASALSLFQYAVASARFAAASRMADKMEAHDKASTTGTTEPSEKLLCLYPRSLIIGSSSNVFLPFKDGSKLVLASNEEAELWDLTTGKKVLSLKHSDLVIGASLSSDEKTLLTITMDRQAPVRLWSLTNGKIIKKYPSPFRNVASNDSLDKTKNYGWNLHDPLSWEFPYSNYLPEKGLGFTSVEFSPTGRQFATGCENGDILLWDVKTGTKIAHMKGETHRVLVLRFSHDATRLFSFSWDGTIALWDTEAKALVKQYEEKERAKSFYDDDNPFLSDGKRFIICSPKTQAIFSTKTGKELNRLPKSADCYFTTWLYPQRTFLLSRKLLDLHDSTTNILLRHFTAPYCTHMHCTNSAARHLPDISSIMEICVENNENTMHEDWTTICIMPLSEFKKPQPEPKTKP